MTLKEELDHIYKQIELARLHVAQIEEAMFALKAAGMYPSVPTEQWQSRNGGEANYLYMLFRWDNLQGGYSGPQGKQKIYVGNKPERIEEARRLARNRRRWEELERARGQLSRWLARIESEVHDLASQAGDWPKVELGHEAPIASRA
jgi:hypothetical protein